MAYLKINGEKYYGKSIWSVARRLYGRSRGLVVGTSCSTAPEWGQVLRESPYGGFDILASISDADGPWGVDNNGDDIDADLAEMDECLASCASYHDDAEYEKQCRIAENSGY